MLANNHSGLCQVQVQAGSRRQVVQQRSDMAAQMQRYKEIITTKESRAHVAIARADALKEAEDGGVAIKAPRGNRSQWHANFKIDEFAQTARDVPVVQKDASGAVILRGLLIVGPGQSLADGCKMLLTELQLGPDAAAGGSWELTALAPDGRLLADLRKESASAELLPLLPSEPCYLLVGNCAPPRGTHADEKPQVVFPPP